MCIGGDEVPVAGTSFLLSFFNVGRRIASSSENFIIFRANVTENSLVVQRYLRLLIENIQYLKNNVFSVTVADETVKVEFKLYGLPNDIPEEDRDSCSLWNGKYEFLI